MARVRLRITRKMEVMGRVGFDLTRQIFARPTGLTCVSDPRVDNLLKNVTCEFVPISDL